MQNRIWDKSINDRSLLPLMAKISSIKMGGDLPPLCKTEDGEWITVKIDLNSFEEEPVIENGIEHEWKKRVMAEYGIEEDKVDIGVYEVPFWAFGPLQTLVAGNRKLERLKKAAEIEYKRSTFVDGQRILNKAEWAYE